MTNAIEQAKREMYEQLKIIKDYILNGVAPSRDRFGVFESDLESYLELLRQDHEALHETARKRFEDIQSLEAVNKDLADRLASMTANRDELARSNLARSGAYKNMKNERDLLRNRQQASDHAQGSATEKGATLHQSSAENVSCATLYGKTAAILGAVVDCQRITTNWAMNDLRAKKAIRDISAVVNGSPHVLQAMKDFEKPTTCMHSFFAIGNDQMKCTFCGVGE